MFSDSLLTMRIPTLVAAAALLSASLTHAASPLIKTGETVAFLGDSITQQGADSTGGYVRLVGSGLAANGIDIKIIPAGISGHKSNQMRARLDNDVLAKKPNWMTLSCGVNDVWHGEKGVPLDEYKANITDIVDRCQKAGVKVVILTSTQISLPVDNPNNVKLIPYNAFLRDLAKERNLPLADLNADMLAEQEKLKAAGVNKSLTADGVHMNYLGTIMMARGVLRAFGLDDSQLAAAGTKWKTIPDAVPLTLKVKISMPEMEALESQAAARKQSLDAFLTENLSASLKSTVAAPKAGSPAK